MYVPVLTPWIGGGNERLISYQINLVLATCWGIILLPLISRSTKLVAIIYKHTDSRPQRRPWKISPYHSKRKSPTGRAYGPPRTIRASLVLSAIYYKPAWRKSEDTDGPAAHPLLREAVAKAGLGAPWAERLFREKIVFEVLLGWPIRWYLLPLRSHQKNGASTDSLPCSDYRPKLYENLSIK